MRPAVAAAQDVGRKLVRQSEDLEVLEQFPEFPALLFGQVFHRLRRARHRGVSALDEGDEGSERVGNRARPERRRYRFDVFAQIGSDVADEAVGAFGRADVVDGEDAFLQSRLLRDSIAHDDEECLGNGGAVADDVKLKRDRRDTRAFFARNDRAPQEKRVAPGARARCAALGRDRERSLFPARKRNFSFIFSRTLAHLPRVQAIALRRILKRRKSVVLSDAYRGIEERGRIGMTRVFEQYHTLDFVSECNELRNSYAQLQF